MKITRNQLRRLIKEELTHIFEQMDDMPAPVEPGAMRRYSATDAQGNQWTIGVDQSGPEGSRGSTRGWGWKLESRPEQEPIILWGKEWTPESWIELDPQVGLKIWGEPADGSEAWRNGEEISFTIEGDSEVFDVVNTHYDFDPAHMFLELATAAGIPEIEA